MMEVFTLQEIQKVTYGGCVLEKVPGVFTFVRMTPNQYAWFDREEDRRFQVRMMCTAGICLDFYTDADYFSLDYEICGMADRGLLHMDVCQNGVLKAWHTEQPAVRLTGNLHYCIEKQNREWNRITYWFPCASSILLKNIRLSEGAKLRTLEEGTLDDSFAGRKRTRLLCYGDSITQGFDAEHPSQGYTARLARYFDMELWNAGLSGYRFDAGLLDREMPFVPDIVTIAYGTNDWNWASSRKQIIQNASDYFDKIIEMYPGIPVFYLSPLWRQDCGVPTAAGDFRTFCLKLMETAEDRGIIVIDGWQAMPHRTEMLADGILHPNDEGMSHVCRYIAACMEREGVPVFGQAADNYGPNGAGEN